MNVYCEIYPYNHYPALDSSVKELFFPEVLFPSGMISSSAGSDGDKRSVAFIGSVFGAQYLAHHFGGEVKASNKREYGRANLDFVDKTSKLFKGIGDNSQVWMSHGDTIEKLPAGCQVIASTKDVKMPLLR